MKLLIADDEIKIREVIKEYGKLYGYEVFEASDGEEAIHMVEKNDFSCVILDIMMPNLDGYTACKNIKKIKNVPVIILSARQDEEDKLYAFDLGIDDYVTKPFSPKELMARVKVVIERSGLKANKEKDSYSYQGISLDVAAHVVTVDGELVHLTNKEFELLKYFLQNPNIVISRNTLLENIWGYDFYGVDRTVDTHIKMLRKNLGPYGTLIKTIRGEGYKFDQV
ncbi:MAG: response regulator transcription factor [Erysipelotrichaceae bacterium]|nr:response regulator transcription factor [Erysipelotrichaceae bacterium]